MTSRHEYQEFYRFAGSVLAKALFEKVPVSVKLHPVLIKRLTGHSQHLSMSDLKAYDLQIYNSLRYLLTTDSLDFEALDMNFTILTP